MPIRMGGEFVEEYLQAALEPAFRNLAFNEHNEIRLFSPGNCYQGMIGAFTTVLIEGGPAVARNISNTQIGHGVIQSGKYQELIDNALALDTSTEAYKMAKGMQDGGIHGNEYNVGELLRAYADANGNAAFMYDVSQKNNPPVNTAERFVETLAGLNQNAKASPKVAGAISSFVTTMQDMGSAVPTEVHDAVMAAYRTFEAGGTNNNAFAVMRTALQSIDSAIMQGLQSGADVTGLVTLRSQMESGLSGNVRSRRSLFNTKAVNTKAMADAVTLLMKLPADVQAAIDMDALSQAYFDFLTAGKKGKTAAQAKALEALFASVEVAIATGKLDAAAVQELQGLLAEIDSEKSVGDNSNHIEMSLGERKSGLCKSTINRILRTPKGSRPDPSTYLSKQYIKKHLKEFSGGVTKIKANPPKGIEGIGLGTFVMPKSVADKAIAQAAGNIRVLEDLLALEPGSLGTHPIRLDIPNPNNLRLPSGNEVGAFPGYWIPGGYTKGGIIEAVIDPVPPSEYIITPLI